MAAANFFVDPVLVATPADDTDRNGIVAWLQNLEIWLKKALSAPFTWLHSTIITELLEGNSRFPGYENLRSLQRKHRLDINPAILARNINAFFRNPEFDLESKLESLGYLAESKNDSVIIHPECIPARWPEFIHTSMCSLLVICSVCKQTAHPFTDALSIVTLKCPDQSQEITISATIVCAIPELACTPGDVITQTFPLLPSPEGLLSSIDVPAPWDKPEDLLSSIDVPAPWDKGEADILSVIEQQRKKDWPTANTLPFCLGSHFCESVTSVGLDTNESVFRRIVWLAAAVTADEVKHKESAKLHPLRANIAGDSPQRIRGKDQAKAWRLDITKHGAGWRLHYWHIPGPNGGTIEFSNVCKESDTTIYE